MLLKSSSTPVLGSLIPSFSDSPNNNNAHCFDTNSVPKHYSIHHQSFNNKSPFHQTGCFHISNNVSCNSSPMSPFISEVSLRRVQSEGNLEGLAYASYSSNNEEYYKYLSQSKKVPARQKCLMLETIPSFSISNSRGRYEEEDDDDDDWNNNEKEEEEEEEKEKDGCFGLSNKMEKMVLSEKIGVTDRSLNLGYLEEEKGGLVSEEMYLARGLGIEGGSNDGNGGGSGDGGGGGSANGGEFHWAAGEGGDKNGREYYKKMLQENPGNPLILGNYAHFLYQSEKDLKGAEEYYLRAILADPKDGEILSQYAKLVWELHNDQDIASAYFERAVQASPEDRFCFAAMYMQHMLVSFGKQRKMRMIMVCQRILNP
ncbi:uncharacterized protein LOC105644478 isoform X2 [Jatropha curcas]|uniref:uncharacterized protein LOC105644478 isoform X2 n=1 Tax=Jatropha curcas TaxID=180498 RepID=UPI0005FAA6F5|nr:uncharacterized protein LOC105644478 isoform X2 [Jatropha curcas]